MNAISINEICNQARHAAVESAMDSLSELPEWMIECQGWAEATPRPMTDEYGDLIFVPGVDADDAMMYARASGVVPWSLEPGDYRVLRAVAV